MKFPFFICLISAFSLPAVAEEWECNPVPISVIAGPAYYASKAKKDGDALYAEALKEKTTEDKSLKLQAALLKYKEAYEVISKDRDMIASEVMKNSCKGSPILVGAPAPKPGAK